MKSILEPQKALLKNGKVIPFGIYDGLIEDTRTSFWDVEGFFPKRRRSQRKCWIYFGSFAPDLYTGIAVVDAGYVATAFAYFYIPSKDLFVEDKLTLPFGFGEKFDPNLYDNWELGKFKIATKNNKIEIAYKGKFDLNIETENNTNGLSFVCPSEGRHFNFTYKNLLLPSNVKLIYKKETFLSDGNTGGIDFSKGYPPNKTIWNWASMVGKTKSGKEIAINIVNQHNANMENAVWLDGERHILSDVIFEKKMPYDKTPWHIKTKEDCLLLDFVPQGARAENLNLIALKSQFTQPYGVFSGSIKINGKTEKFTGNGVVEDHLAVW